MKTHIKHTHLANSMKTLLGAESRLDTTPPTTSTASLEDAGGLLLDAKRAAASSSAPTAANPASHT